MQTVRSIARMGVYFGGAYGATRCGMGYYEYKADPEVELKVDRALRLWTVAAPVVAHYRLVEAKHKWFKPASKQVADGEWHDLDLLYSGKILDLLRELKGMYVKYGQIGGSSTNTFSKVWQDKLRTLEDAVPAQHASVVLETVRQEMGRDPAEIFSEFEEKPLGSASIGQVHRAVLRDSGEEVAVKIQYPDAQKLFMSDMATIRQFFELCAPEQVIILAELERSLQNEFDYKVEAENLLEVRANMGSTFEHEAVVPRPFPDLCTRKMLVMEMLEGPKLIDGLNKYGEEMAAAEGLSFAELRARIEAEYDEHGFPAKYDGPSAKEIAMYNKWCTVKDGAANCAIWFYNRTYGWITGQRAEYWSTTSPPNPPHLVDVLMRVHGDQLFRHGFFNADPHPGNFLLLPDGRVGLIDYGATKRLTRGERLLSAVLYIALAREDREMVFDICRNGGYKSKYMDEDIIYKMTKFGFDSIGRDVCGKKNVLQFIDECFAADPWEETADNLIMVNMLSFRLRTVGMAMQHPVVCSKYWAPIAEQALIDEGLPYENWNLDLMQELTGHEIRMASS